MTPSSTIRSLVTAATLATTGGACGVAPPAAEPRPTLRLATGMVGASFQPLGRALASTFLKRLAMADVVTMETSGSVSNLHAIQNGEADVALAYADTAYMAYTGQLPDNPKPFSQVRAIAVLHVSPVHLLVGAQSAIRSPADLRGKRIGMGPAGSGTAVTSALLLEAFAVPLKTIQPFSLSFSEAAAQLADGHLDAAVVVSSDPVDSVQRALSAGARLLEIDGPAVAGLRSKYPFLKPALIPEGTYRVQPTSVHTVGMDTLLIARAGMPDRFAAALADAFFSSLPELGGTLPTPFRFVDPERASATPIPLHPGAARYYRERELFR